MKINITNLFDVTGKSLSGKVQLKMDQAHHNCAADPEQYAYEQTTPVYVRDNGTEPAEIVSEADDYDNQIDVTVAWEITNPDAEEEDACDWGKFDVYADNQGYDLDSLFGK